MRIKRSSGRLLFITIAAFAVLAVMAAIRSAVRVDRRPAGPARVAPERTADRRAAREEAGENEAFRPAASSKEAAPVELQLSDPAVVRHEEGGVIRAAGTHYEQTFSADQVRLAFGTRSLSLRLKDVRIGNRSLVDGASLSRVEPRLEKGATGEVIYQRGEVAEKYLLRGEAVEQVFVLPETLAPLRTGGCLSITVGLESPLRPVHKPGAQRDAGDRVEFRDAWGLPVLTYGSATAIDACGRTRLLTYALQGTDLEMVLDAAFLASAAFPLTVDPTIALNKSGLTFNAPLGGPNPAPQSVKLTNTSATSSLRWRTTVTTTDGAPWLVLNPSRGRRKPSQSKSVNVSVNMTTLAAGQYTGNIRFFDQTDASNFVDLPVTLNVRGQPFIDVNPAGLAFNAPVGSGLQPSKFVTLTNQGGQPLNWTAAAIVNTPIGGTWLTVTPATGTLLGGEFTILTVTVDATGLAASATPYDGVIRITGNATNSPVDILVSLTVNNLAFIEVTPTPLDFTGPVGNPPPIFQTVTLRNAGGSPLDWNIAIAGSSAWLTVTPLSGIGLLPNQTTTFEVSVSAGSLPTGTYTDTIVVSGNSSNSPVSIGVTFTIEDLPSLDVAPQSLTFDAPVGGPDPDPQSVTVSNQGGGTLNWTASVQNASSWLSVGPTGGSLRDGASADLQVAVTVGTLAAGVYSDSIDVDDGGGTVLSVFVTLSVNAQPKIRLTPSSLVIDVPENGSPVTATLTLQNVGDTATPLAWTVSDNAPWLSVTPAAGNLPSGGSTTLTVTADPGTLAAGAYVGEITASSTNASNPPQKTIVSMNVNAQPKIKLTPTSLVFDVPLNGAAAQQTVTLENVGDTVTPLSFTTGANASWVGVTPGSGSLTSGQGAPLTVTATPGTLSAGTYTAEITVNSSNASNAPQKVFVMMNVNAQPKIRLTPASLVFDLPLSGPPASQTVTLQNVGDGATPLNFTTSDNATWLSVAPANGNVSAGANTALTVTANPGTLAAGAYTGRITVSSTNATNSPQLVSVTMNLSDQPRIGLSPASLTFTTGAGTTPADQTVTVTNTGGLTLVWSAAATVNTPPAGTWLSLVGTTSGSLTAGLSATFDARVDVTGLTPGTYSGTLTVTGAAPASNSPQTVSVTLNVLASPAIGVSPTSLTFTTPLGTSPANQMLTVTNMGGLTLDWSASAGVTTPAGGTWLSLAGTTSGMLTTGSASFDVVVNVTGLSAGTYSGTVTVTGAPGTSNSPQTVPVTLRVLSDPAIGLSPAGLTFNVPEGGPNPANQTVTVTNTGDQTLAWSATGSVTTPAGGTWLNLVGTTSGSLTAGLSATFDVMVDVAGLAAGTYDGVLTVTGTLASNSPQTMGVTLNVIAPPPASVPSKVVDVGYCGSSGLDLLLPLGLVWLYRRRRAAGRSCERRRRE